MKRLIASLSFYTPLTRIDIHRLLDQERQAMLKKAEETAAKGDYASAQKLAEKARRQSENAVTQAKEQEQAWQAAVVK